MVVKTFTVDADCDIVSGGDSAKLQKSPANSVSLKFWGGASFTPDQEDNSWDDVLGTWTTANFGIATTQESPSGQLNTLAGDAGGTNSGARIYKDIVITESFTTRHRIYADALGTGGYPPAELDTILFTLYTGIHVYNFYAMADRIVYDESGWKLFAETVIPVGSWFTFQLSIDNNTVYLFINDIYIANINLDANVIFGPRSYIGVYNYPTSPVTTEAHWEYSKFGSDCYIFADDSPDFRLVETGQTYSADAGVGNIIDVTDFSGSETVSGTGNLKYQRNYNGTGDWPNAGDGGWTAWSTIAELKAIMLADTSANQDRFIYIKSQLNSDGESANDAQWDETILTYDMVSIGPSIPVVQHHRQQQKAA